MKRLCFGSVFVKVRYLGVSRSFVWTERLSNINRYHVRFWCYNIPAADSPLKAGYKINISLVFR